MLRDFVDLQLLVIGIPSVTQFHESFYNRVFAEGLIIIILSMSNFFTFFHQIKKKKKQTKKEKESTVPAPVPALAYG